MLAALAAAPAYGRTLTVGPGQAFERPSAAAAVAAEGDTVLIEPGIYYDCVVSVTRNLTFAGHGPGAVLTDRTCEGKALLVLRGDGAVVRDLTLTRARVADGNGAGIRLEGQGLTLERVQFVNNQVGLLSGDGLGRITVTDCVFEGGGVGGERPLFALYVGGGTELLVTGSRFAAPQGGQIRSGAQRTELRGDTVETGANGLGLQVSGALDMEGATITVGPSAADGAVRVEGEGPVTLRRNRLINQAGRPATLLLDWSRSSPVLDANVIAPGDVEVASSGAWRHRASNAYHGAKDGLRHLAGSVKRQLLRVSQ